MRIKIICCSLFMLLVFTDFSFAGVHETFGIGAKATALGGAFTAYADDFSAIHYNPAGLNQQKKSSVNLGLHVIDIDYEQKVSQKDASYGPESLDGTHSKNNSDLIYVPTFGMIYKPHDSKWTLAYGAYLPFGAHLWSNSHTANNRYSASETYNTRLIYAAPTVSYQMMDNLSIGLSVGMGSTDEGYTIQLRLPGLERRLPPPYNSMTGLGLSTDVGPLKCNLEDDFTLSANVGILWKALDNFTIGLTYRSEAHSKMEGHSTFKYSQTALNLLNDLGIHAPAVETFDTDLSFTHPQEVVLGFKFDVNNKWSLMLDVSWTDWSVRNTESFRYDGSPAILTATYALGADNPTDSLVIKRSWEDTYEFRIGTEYRPKDWLALRFGYHYRPCAIQEKYWDNTWPLTDAHVFSLGSGIKLNKRITMDLAYSLAWCRDLDIESGESRNLTGDRLVYSPYAGNEVNTKTNIHNFMINFQYTF